MQREPCKTRVVNSRISLNLLKTGMDSLDFWLPWVRRLIQKQQNLMMKNNLSKRSTESRGDKNHMWQTWTSGMFLNNWNRDMDGAISNILHGKYSTLHRDKGLNNDIKVIFNSCFKYLNQTLQHHTLLI